MRSDTPKMHRTVSQSAEPIFFSRALTLLCSNIFSAHLPCCALKFFFSCLLIRGEKSLTRLKAGGRHVNATVRSTLQKYTHQLNCPQSLQEPLIKARIKS